MLLLHRLSVLSTNPGIHQGFRFYIFFSFINIHLLSFPSLIVLILVIFFLRAESILSEKLPFFRLHNPLSDFSYFYPPSAYSIPRIFSTCRSSLKIRVTLFLVIPLLSNPWIRRYRYISRMLNAISIIVKITSTAPWQ